MNLKWLDLSFNLIEQIEGLDNLSKLTDLSLYSNNIKEIGGLENLHELNVLSLGKNNIKNNEVAVSYLKTLKNKLEVLKLAENPGTKGAAEKDYKLYTIAYLDGLKYIDYELIEEEIKKEALSKHHENI